MDTEAYNREALSVRHLGDSKTYSMIYSTAQDTLHMLQDAVYNFIHSDLEKLRSQGNVDTHRLTCTLNDVKSNDENRGKQFMKSLLVPEPRLGLFYVNPKLHKESTGTFEMPLKCPCRPIMSMVNHPCMQLARLIHNLLSPAMDGEYIEDYLRDTPDLLRYMEHIRDGTHTPPVNCAPHQPRLLGFFP